MPIISNGKQFVLLDSRHDQTILSMLRMRHKLPTVLKTWDFYEFRSLEHAPKKIIYFTIIMEVMKIYSCNHNLHNY